MTIFFDGKCFFDVRCFFDGKCGADFQAGTIRMLMSMAGAAWVKVPMVMKSTPVSA
jgi:hypothetical protein